MTLNLNHLNIVVSDLERSIEFYSRFFGCAEWLREGDGFAILRCGDFDLALTRGKPSFAPGFHFGFRLETRAEAEEWHRRLMGQPVQFLEPWLAEDDYASFSIEDPDGYRVQLYWERER